MGLIYMYGKILKISNNDLYGNVDDRRVSLFAAFTHKKYMNKYAIFTFTDEYNKNKLYCASIHLKDTSIVTFSVREDEIAYINKFAEELLAGNIDTNEYELIDISNISKIELISNSPIDFNRLIELDNLTIPKDTAQITTVDTPKKPVFLYVLLIICLIFLGGVIYIHYNPSILDVKLNKLDCTMTGYDKKLELPYTSVATVKFDRKNILLSIDKVDTYTFSDNEKYYDFKDNNRESTSFKVEGSYKYNDDDLTLKTIYQDKLIIYEYDEVSRYMKKEGYDCVEGTYTE